MGDLGEARGPTVLAIGGHSLLSPDLPPTVANQFATTTEAMGPVAELVRRHEHLVLTHGNGPQVGFMQLRGELARDHVPEVPLDSLVADSQGAMGYMIERALRSRLRSGDPAETAADQPPDVVTIVTEVEVDPDDPAFAHPDKPIGRFYTPEEGARLAAERGWPMSTDPKRGVRRVVPSPAPVRIVQLDTIRRLIDLGITVICCGGGGIPVSSDPDGATIEAVIDKDRVSMLLAVELGASRLVITTSVDMVYADFYAARPRPLATLTRDEAADLLAEGQFAAGSMAPKIEAAVDYLDRIDGEVVICSPTQLLDALDGRAGTRIRRHRDTDLAGPDGGTTP